MWIYSEECGSPDAVAEFLCLFLEKFDTKHRYAIQFSFANTCSKMRVDEFGGGYVVVTAREVQWFGWQQADDLVKALELERIQGR